VRNTAGQQRPIRVVQPDVPAGAVSISIEDSSAAEPPPFCPLRTPGPHLGELEEKDVRELDLFSLFFTDELVEKMVHCTNLYAESKKDSKPQLYMKFKRHTLTKGEMMQYIGCLLILSISNVRSYRSVWDHKSTQYLLSISQLMSRNRFEEISAFLHVVSPEEEQANSDHPLKKILQCQDYIKQKCFDCYQPLQELSVDERMVRSKARSHFKQYMKDKPTKWGYKYWVIADILGYTIDFDVYYGATQQNEVHPNGLAYAVIMKLVEPFRFQGYHVYCDNFYTSPLLFTDLFSDGIPATGTLRTNRRGVPDIVKDMKTAMDSKRVQRGTGYYYREAGTPNVYVAWRDNKCVSMLTTAFPGHTTSTVRRRVKESGTMEVKDVPIPTAISNYNKYMGGVDKSDQYISYHRVIRKTPRYWKTMFYHLIEIVVTNATIIYNWVLMKMGQKRITNNIFRDNLIQQIMSRYAPPNTTPVTLSEPRAITISHGSCFSEERKQCSLCQTHKTLRICPDCPNQPHLCQVVGRDCHKTWHSSSSFQSRQRYKRNKKRVLKLVAKAVRQAGRPKGSKNRKKRTGYYRSH
jgi:hypothetical protein